MTTDDGYTTAELDAIRTALAHAYHDHHAATDGRTSTVHTLRRHGHTVSSIITTRHTHPSMYQIGTVSCVWTRAELDDLAAPLIAFSLRAAACPQTGVEDTAAWPVNR